MEKIKIEMKDLSKQYTKTNYKLFTREYTPSTVAFQNVDLNIQENEFVSIVGPSGCGKTTLLRIAGGLIEASSGKVLIDGKEVKGPQKNVSFVFQHIGLLPWRTVEDNIRLAQQLLTHKKLSEEEKEVGQLLEMVGLGGFGREYPKSLSGGMQQRVGIARALSTQPDVLLMDEPFGALDAQTRLILQGELLKICESYRSTVLFITHDIDEAIYLSDRVVIMAGRPSYIKDVIHVPFKKPRYQYDIRSEKLYHELRNTIWNELHSDVNNLEVIS